MSDEECTPLGWCHTRWGYLPVQQSEHRFLQPAPLDNFTQCVRCKEFFSGQQLQSEDGWKTCPALKHVRYVWSGLCLCGHSHEDHHGNLICSIDYVDDAGHYRVPGECEYYCCNEEAGLDECGEFHCGHYVDTEDPDTVRRITWNGTFRPDTWF